METIASIEDIIKYKQERVDAIISRYGSGVRPSHVSADLAILNQYIRDAECCADVLRLGPITAAAIHQRPLDEVYAWLNQNQKGN